MNITAAPGRAGPPPKEEPARRDDSPATAPRPFPLTLTRSRAPGQTAAGTARVP
jgi:hypothetical protein